MPRVLTLGCATATMADSDGHGIKELLQAEKQAADIVQEAKKSKPAPPSSLMRSHDRQPTESHLAVVNKSQTCPRADAGLVFRARWAPWIHPSCGVVECRSRMYFPWSVEREFFRDHAVFLTSFLLRASAERQDKMKKAKEDAEREIAEYRKQREEQFEAYKAEHSTGGTSSSAALRTQTDAAVSALEAEAAKNRKNVVDLLVKYVTTVQAN